MSTPTTVLQHWEVLQEFGIDHLTFRDGRLQVSHGIENRSKYQSHLIQWMRLADVSDVEMLQYAAELAATAREMLRETVNFIDLRYEMCAEQPVETAAGCLHRAMGVSAMTLKVFGFAGDREPHSTDSHYGELLNRAITFRTNPHSQLLLEAWRSFIQADLQLRTTIQAIKPQTEGV